jgi:hypothetical protein
VVAVAVVALQRGGATETQLAVISGVHGCQSAGPTPGAVSTVCGCPPSSATVRSSVPAE